MEIKHPSLAGDFYWSGNYGIYKIPVDIVRISKLRKDGMPDKRFKGNRALIEWVAAKEASEEKEWRSVVGRFEAENGN